MAFSLDELIQTADKEVKRREFAYPFMIRDGKMRPDFADRQLSAMKAISQTLRDLKKGNMPNVGGLTPPGGD